MNYHSDKWIMEQIARHHKEALSLYNDNQIIGVFCQGSQNYGLDIETSDIDTKCILTPSFKDIVMAHNPISTTHILDNNEHLDAKDIRKYLLCFRKQNLNFLEILFTPFYMVNPIYAEQWNRLIENREAIANLNRYRGVQSMKGIALEKYHAMEHPYPSKIHLIQKYGYDFKQLHHLLRVEDCLEKYINGESYENCLRPTDPEYLMCVKRGYYNLDKARVVAAAAKEHVEEMAEAFYMVNENVENEETNALLDDVQYEIMRIAVERELIK